MNSLTTRLLVTGMLVLLLFALLTGFALELAAVRNAESAEQDRLQGLVYGLLGAAEPQADGTLTVPAGLLPESRLGRPLSGVEATIHDDSGQRVWSSPSATGTDQALPRRPDPGQWYFERRTDAAGNAWFELVFAVDWVLEDGRARRYYLDVRQDVAAFEQRRRTFRYALWLWLGVLTAGLLLLQWGVLRWGLRPLHRLDRELEAIREGRAESVSSVYPRELQPLGDGLNTLLENERGLRSRYRNALADLAHSLKTPLAVLRATNERRSDPGNEAERRLRFEEQIERIDQIVDYQLRRAAAAGSRTWAGRELLRPQLERIVAALQKVHADKSIRFEIVIPADLRVALEQGDLMELFGNLLDNASKHCARRVRVGWRRTGTEVIVWVGDDGAGFGVADPWRLVARGARQDTQHDGQGMGLALVAEILAAAGGTLRFGRADLGGALVEVVLPA